MDIKKRIIVSNTIIAIVPVIVTIIVVFGFLFISSRFVPQDIKHSNFKNHLNARAELVTVRNNMLKENIDNMETVELEEELAHKLITLSGKTIIIKGHKIVSSPDEFTKIDIEKCVEIGKSNIVDKKIKVNNIYYIIEAINLNLKDKSSINIVLLAPIGEDISLFNKIMIIGIMVYILTFIIVNITMSYLLSKRIIEPIKLLKKATNEISNGNLECEIIEDGDKEIKELCHGFEVMRVQLKDSTNMKIKYDNNRKVLVSSISHDLKTPITSIKGYVEGILDGVANTPEKRERYLKTIYSKAEHIDQMIDDLLLYSKLDLNQIPFNFEKTDIVEYFNYCICEIEPELIKSNIKIELKNDLKNCKYIIIDRDRMRRVILNIIENSRKYMDKKDGKVLLNLRETNSSVIIEIRDNGPGINNKDINKIFDRFYRADYARSGAKGSGLGLSIAKQIVEGHKGRIWAISHENEGTSIILSFGRIRIDQYERDLNL